MRAAASVLNQYRLVTTVAQVSPPKIVVVWVGNISLTYESRITYIVPAPKLGNHIDISKNVDKTIIKALEIYQISRVFSLMFRILNQISSQSIHKILVFNEQS